MESVNRNPLLYCVSIYRHPRYIAANCGEQIVALYRGCTVYGAGCGSFPAEARRDKESFVASTRQTLRVMRSPGSFSLVEAETTT
jgi:hypothetical protein